jgi:hypothetical protein
MKFLFLLCFFAFNAQAEFRKLKIQNLDFDYLAPHGTGMLDKISIGMALQPVPYPIEIKRSENAFELISTYLDFTWNDPWSFIFESEKALVKKTSLDLGSSHVHQLESEYLMLKPKGRGEYITKGLKGNCEGNTVGSFKIRLMEDCRNQLDLNILRTDFPSDFFLFRLLDNLPRFPGSGNAGYTGDNFVLKVRKGDYNLQLKMKYWLYLTFKATGHVQFENNYKIIAIRLDRVRFGYLNVTTIVMNKLKEILKYPNVKFDPPWIRINLEGNYETQSH